MGTMTLMTRRTSNWRRSAERRGRTAEAVRKIIVKVRRSLPREPKSQMSRMRRKMIKLMMAQDDEVEDLKLEDLDSDLDMEDDFGAGSDAGEDDTDQEEDSDDESDEN